MNIINRRLTKLIYQQRQLLCPQQKNQLQNSIERQFCVVQKQLEPLNVLNLQLNEIFYSDKDGHNNQEQIFQNNLQKYMIVKRKSLVTGGNILELKGGQVQQLLKESVGCLLNELEKYEVQDIIDLMLLDHSTMRHNQGDLLRYIDSKSKQQQSSISKSQYIFLVKCALFCNADASSQKALSHCVQNVLKDSLEHLETSPYTACFLLVIYYQQLNKRFNLRDKEQCIYRKQHDQQLQLERQFREDLGISNLFDTHQLLYQIVIDRVLDMNPTNQQLSLLIQELAYIGQFKRQDLMTTIYDKFDLSRMSLVQAVELITSTASKNITISNSIYQAFISLLSLAIESEQIIHKQSANSFQDQSENILSLNHKSDNIQQQNDQSNNIQKDKFNNIQYLKDNRELKSFLYGKALLQSSIEFQDEIAQDNYFSIPQTKIECLWILIRNYDESHYQIHNYLFYSISKHVNAFQIRHLLSLLQCFTGFQMYRNIKYLESGTGDTFKLHNQVLSVKRVVSLLLNRMKQSSTSLSDKQKCGLYLNLVYLINSNQLTETNYHHQLKSLQHFYKTYALNNEISSKTEDKFLAAIESLQEEQLISQEVERGKLIDDIYYVDFMIGADQVIEINGDLHHNKQTQYIYRQNYLLKLFYLKFKNYKVSVIDYHDYISIINNQSEIKKLIMNKITS